MHKDIQKAPYLRASLETPTYGVNSGKRAEPNLDQARIEFAKSASRVLNHFFNGKHGPLSEALGEITILEFLKSFEASFETSKHDLSLIVQEVMDRIFNSR